MKFTEKVRCPFCKEGKVSHLDAILHGLGDWIFLNTILVLFVLLLGMALGAKNLTLELEWKTNLYEVQEKE